MSSDEYNRMLFERLHKEQRWENQPAVGWTVEDLDSEEILSTVEEAERTGRLKKLGSREAEDMLRGLNLLRDGVLLRAAAVLFGKSKRLEDDMPQCRVRAARFRGLDRLAFLDNRQFHGNAFRLLRSASEFLRSNVSIASRFESGRIDRIDEPRYPPLATREALANALCHRDYAMGTGSIGLAIYDDRLEVTSPGPLHFGLTPRSLFQPHESKPWNPLIARTFYRRGIIEEWGQGTLKMVALTKGAGLPRPEIKEQEDCVIVRLRPPENGVVNRQEAILALLDGANDGLALRDIAAGSALGISLRQVKRSLAGMRARGLVEPTGRGLRARWRIVRSRESESP